LSGRRAARAEALQYVVEFLFDAVELGGSRRGRLFGARVREEESKQGDRKDEAG
jgi:hypothetical protein